VIPLIALPFIDPPGIGQRKTQQDPTWAPFIGASLGVMEADTLRMRGKRPFVFSNLKTGEGVEPIANFIVEKGGLAKTAA